MVSRPLRAARRGARVFARLAACLLLAGVTFASVPGAAASAQPAGAPAAPAQTLPEGYEPMANLPPQEQIPAAPLLIAAYAFAWVMILVYLWLVWRGLAAVERELGEVTRRVADARRS